MMTSDMEKLVTLPVLPVKNTVLFPYAVLPLTIGRPASVAAVDAALSGEEKELVIVTQRDASVEAPKKEDFFTIGTKALIKKMARGEGTVQVIVQGIERVGLIKFEQTEPFLKARVRLAPLPEDKSTEIEALHRTILELASKALALAQPSLQIELSEVLPPTEDPLQHVYLLGSLLSLEVEKEQALLEAETRAAALRLMHSYLVHEVQVLEVRSQIASQAQTEMDKQQREYLLRQQLAAIQAELGEQNPEQVEGALLRQRLTEADLPDEVRRECEQSLARLEKLPAAAPDYHVTRTHLELLLALPWRKSTTDTLDLAFARQVLDEDHYDLKEVKERILEHLGVLKLNPKAKAPILCFVGPPGVGKTSLGQSIARSLGRKFERISLGGMHDEAELRGHRRTYIGSMPGRIIQGLRRAGF